MQYHNEVKQKALKPHHKSWEAISTTLIVMKLLKALIITAAEITTTHLLFNLAQK